MRIILLIGFVFCTFIINAQDLSKPKLMVAIVVDQMRYEYLERFYPNFGEEGFKRMLKEGFNFRNNHYDMTPTATGPGHSAVFSGANPSVSGVVGNGWYDRASNSPVNVVNGMKELKTIGLPDTLTVGQAGPGRLLVSTMADELKFSSGFQSKVFAVSIKDRSAILAAGHTGDGAFWYDGFSGKFVSSSHYMEELPSWVTHFNESGYTDSLQKEVWDLALPADSYMTSRADDNPFEFKFRNQDKPTFPYDLDALRGESQGHYYISYTPYGNEMVAKLALDAIREEEMGKGQFTDFMAINFSATDYAGHKWGPYSREIEDMYIRLDQTMAHLLNQLDKEIGKNNYTVFLTADHGAVTAPMFLLDKNIPAGIFNPSALKNRLQEHIRNELGIDSAVLHMENFQVYLDFERCTDAVSSVDLIDEVIAFLENEPFVHRAFSANEIRRADFIEGPYKLMQNGFHPRRSGDVLYVSNPGWFGFSGGIATGHGWPFSYDTHVPLLWFGHGIPAGESVRKVSITDIAPTVAMICRTMIPNGSFGNVLVELFE